VSGNKRRFIDSRFDLDLTYIADRLVGMALPCIAGAMYRNDIHMVSKFFTYNHYGRFQIFNLCEPFEEAGNGNYDRELFYKQVCKVPQRDHNICALQALVNFAKQAVAFLNIEEDNIVAIHCRGGKGRTGSFCCAVLIWSGFSRTAEHALAYFASRRTDLSIGGAVQGVSSPSQIRYVHYIEAIKYLHFDYVSRRQLLFSRIVMHGVPLMDVGGCQVTFVVETMQGLVYDHAKTHGLVRCALPRSVFVFEVGHLPVFNDVAIRFYSFDSSIDPQEVEGLSASLGPGGASLIYTTESGEIITGRQLIFTQFHTSFHTGPTISFARHEIDGSYSAKASKFPAEFSLDYTVIDLEAHEHNKKVLKAVLQLDRLLMVKRGSFIQTQPEVEALLRSSPSSFIEETNAAVMQTVFLDKTIGPGQMGPGSVTSVVDFGGLSQKAVGAEVSSQIGRQTMWSGRRHLEMGERMHGLLTACGAVEVKFKRGQTIRDMVKAKGKKRNLMLITSGIVVVYPSTRQDWSDDRYFDPGLYRGVMLRGKGDFLGALDFMLGSGEDHLTAKVVARSETTVLKLAMNHQTTTQPTFFSNLVQPWQINELYESLGRYMCTLAMCTEMNVQSIHETSVKHDVWASSEEYARTQQIQRLRVRFQIPLSLHCDSVVFCKIRSGGSMRGSAALFAHLRCRMFVFADFVYLVGRAGDVSFAVEDMISVKVTGRLLKLMVREKPILGIPLSREGSSHDSSHTDSESQIGAKDGRAQRLRNALNSGTASWNPAAKSFLKKRSSLTPGIPGNDVESWGSFNDSNTNTTNTNTNNNNSNGDIEMGVTPPPISLLWGTVEDAEAGPGTLARSSLEGSNDGKPGEGVTFSARSPKHLRSPSKMVLGATKAMRNVVTTFNRRETMSTLFGLGASKDEAPNEDNGSVTVLDMFDIGTALETRDCIARQIANKHRENLDLENGNIFGMNSSEPENTDSIHHLGALDEEEPEEKCIDAGIQQLLESVASQTFEENDIILNAGALDRSIIFIVTGKVFSRNHTGDVLIRRGRGEILGEVSYFQTGNIGSPTDWVAGSPEVVVRILTGNMIDRWRLDDPIKAAMINRYLARIVCLRLRRLVLDNVMFDSS